MGLVSEFKEFALKGNVVDMAVGVILGAAFGKIVNSMVQDIIMPPIGFIIGGVNFKDLKIVLQEKVAHVVDGKVVVVDGKELVDKPEVAILWGTFVNTTLEFLIVAACLFIVIRAMNRLLAARGSLVPGFIRRT